MFWIVFRSWIKMEQSQLLQLNIFQFSQILGQIAYLENCSLLGLIQPLKLMECISLQLGAWNY